MTLYCLKLNRKQERIMEKNLVGSIENKLKQCRYKKQLHVHNAYWDEIFCLCLRF